MLSGPEFCTSYTSQISYVPDYPKVGREKDQDKRGCEEKRERSDMKVSVLN